MGLRVDGYLSTWVHDRGMMTSMKEEALALLYQALDEMRSARARGHRDQNKALVEVANVTIALLEQGLQTLEQDDKPV